MVHTIGAHAASTPAVQVSVDASGNLVIQDQPGNSTALVVMGNTVKSIPNVHSTSETVPLQAGAGCTTVKKNATTCSFTGRIVADLGDGEDAIDADAPNGATITGGPDTDFINVHSNSSADVTITGDGDGTIKNYNDGNDEIHVTGTANATVEGGLMGGTITTDAGNDVVHAHGTYTSISTGAGNDKLYADDGLQVDMDGGAGADEFIPGTGSTTVSYANSPSAVNVSLDDQANDGGAADGFADNVHAGVWRVMGSPFADTISTGSTDGSTPAPSTAKTRRHHAHHKHSGSNGVNGVSTGFTDKTIDVYVEGNGGADNVLSGGHANITVDGGTVNTRNDQYDAINCSDGAHALTDAGDASTGCVPTGPGV